MELRLAQGVAAKLLKRLGCAPPGGGGAVVGSVRRGKADLKDIELILPWGQGESDPVWVALRALVELDGDALFGQDTKPRAFVPVRGVKPGFRGCSIRCAVDRDPRWSKLTDTDFQVDLFRFDGGPAGNRGWIELIRTGPAKFGEACLAHFKRNGGGGSRAGYLIDSAGRPIPTPTEVSAFQALNVAYLEPHERAPEALRTQRAWHEPVPAEAIPF